MNSTSVKIRIGFVVNPYAGVGGPAGYKGSDSAFIQQKVQKGELEERAHDRAVRFLRALTAPKKLFTFVTPAGSMGEAALQNSETSFSYHTLQYDVPATTTNSNTKDCVAMMLNEHVDLILFVGGDGTARDVCSVVGLTVPVLGIPSGVKMHSGVFAINPHSAAELVVKLISGELIKLAAQEVRDIDEDAFRNGIVNSQYYGEMNVPYDDQFVQSVKQGGGEPDELALADIAAEIQNKIEDLPEESLILFGPGSTTQFIQNELGCESTLLGVDAWLTSGGCGELIEADINATRIEQLTKKYSAKIKAIITPIGGQGHLIGRGNQQFSPAALRVIGKENLWVVSTARKLHALNEKPLLLDTNDDELDKKWSGFISVITGYQQQMLYRVTDGVSVDE